MSLSSICPFHESPIHCHPSYVFCTSIQVWDSVLSKIRVWCCYWRFYLKQQILIHTISRLLLPSFLSICKCMSSMLVKYWIPFPHILQRLFIMSSNTFNHELLPKKKIHKGVFNFFVYFFPVTLGDLYKYFELPLIEVLLGHMSSPKQYILVQNKIV